MCGCGCFESRQPLFRLPGPEDGFYVAWWYHGCKGCDGPPAFDIERHSVGEDDLQGLTEISEPRWADHGGDFEGQAYRILDFKPLDDFLKKQVALCFRAVLDDPDMADPAGVDVVADEMGDEFLAVLGAREGSTPSAAGGDR